MPGGGRSFKFFRATGGAEEGSARLHTEDEVDVGGRHGDAWQEGESKSKTANAAAEGGGQPVHQAGNTHTCWFTALCVCVC